MESIRRPDTERAAADTLADVREQLRLPLRVKVTTWPVLHDCWSVNVSASGIGLTGRTTVRDPGPQCGANLELAFKLPDGDPVSARGRVTWISPTPTGPQPGVALGVEFEPLAPAPSAALDRFIWRAIGCASGSRCRRRAMLR